MVRVRVRVKVRVRVRRGSRAPERRRRTFPCRRATPAATCTAAAARAAAAHWAVAAAAAVAAKAAAAVHPAAMGASVEVGAAAAAAVAEAAAAAGWWAAVAGARLKRTAAARHESQATPGRDSSATGPYIQRRLVTVARPAVPPARRNPSAEARRPGRAAPWRLQRWLQRRLRPLKACCRRRNVRRLLSRGGTRQAPHSPG